MSAKKKTMPAQKQTTKPGREHEMTPRPKAEDAKHRGSGKLAGKVALITGGDSGIGRAVAIAFAKEGADVAINCLEEDKDAKETQRLVEEHGRKCVLLPANVGDEKNARRIVERTVKEMGKLDILGNNASEQHPQDSIEGITAEQLERTFRTNVFGYFFMTKAAMKHLREGSCIINTTSVTAYKGSAQLLDYSATKAPRSPSRARFHRRSRRRKFGLTEWRRGRSGRHSFPPRSRVKRSKHSAAMCR